MAAEKPSREKAKKDLTQKAYQAIRQMLFYKEILPGQKIKYKDLAERIGVSMTPVIQAIKWLEFRNIVRHETNKGYYVNEVSIKEVGEVYDTRQLLEVALVPEIIRHLDSRGLEKMHKAFENYKAAVESDKYNRRILTDMEFHMTLASLSNCQIQLKMLNELFDVLLLRYSRTLFFHSVMDTSLGDHKRMLACLESRDEKALAAAVNAHVTQVRAHIISGMEKMIDDRRQPLSDRYSF